MECSTENKRHVYCVDCRRYPFFKGKCTEQHEYQKEYIEGKYAWTCDVCGLSGTMKAPYGYHDNTCDLCFCQQCYNELPEPTPENNHK